MGMILLSLTTEDYLEDFKNNLQNAKSDSGNRDIEAVIIKNEWEGGSRPSNLY